MKNKIDKILNMVQELRYGENIILNPALYQKMQDISVEVSLLSAAQALKDSQDDSKKTPIEEAFDLSLTPLENEAQDNMDRISERFESDDPITMSTTEDTVDYWDGKLTAFAQMRQIFKRLPSVSVVSGERDVPFKWSTSDVVFRVEQQTGLAISHDDAKKVLVKLFEDGVMNMMWESMDIIVVEMRMAKEIELSRRTK